MNCGYKEKNILYFYGELPEDASAEVRAHVGTCPSCAADLAVLKSLSDGLDSFQPRPPELAEPAAGFLGAPYGGSFAGFMRRAMAGAMAAAFLAAFYLPGLNVSSSGWQGDIDSGLENIENRIYTLDDDTGDTLTADFDYAYSDLETRKEQAAEEVQ